jgi:hypothetical protein
MNRHSPMMIFTMVAGLPPIAFITPISRVRSRTLIVVIDARPSACQDEESRCRNQDPGRNLDVANHRDVEAIKPHAPLNAHAGLACGGTSSCVS